MDPTNVVRGAELAGTVATVVDFYATVRLDNQLGMAVVHISQLSDAFLAPPMSDHLSVGDRLAGVIVATSSKFGYPELSPRTLSRKAPRSALGLPNKLETCDVLRANEFYALIKTTHGTGVLANRFGPWSRFQVLFESRLLTEGQSIELLSTGEHDESGRLVMRFPIFPLARELRANTTLSGEIVSWRPNATRKKDEMLRNILYIHTGSGYLVRVECNDLFDVTENYDIGETVAVRLSDLRPLREIPFATLEIKDGEQGQPVRKLRVGENVTGKVRRLLPTGAIIIVADYCSVFLPRSEVMPGKGFIGTALQCGDMVEGQVTDLRPTGDKTFPEISFNRLVEPSTVSHRPRSPLIDVAAERKAGVRGGFGRDAAFRSTVLEANAYTCCFCGKNFSAGGATAMEAAHIVPRGKRGTDNVANGLCLCPVHHWAFDKGMWTLDEALVIRIGLRR